MQALLDARHAVGIAEVEATIVRALELPGQDFSNMDPIATALEDEQAAADAIKLQAANASIMNVVDAGIALVRGAGAQIEASVMSDALYGAMADALAGLSDDEGETLDLTEVDDLGAILKSAVESLTLDDAQQALIDAAVADVAAALSAVNQRIDDAAERFVDAGRVAATMPYQTSLDCRRWHRRTCARISRASSPVRPLRFSMPATPAVH
ncbi:hypothetical protein FPL11_06515 [Spiribacter aquaticus]|uniref:Uncharacterized protein n=1 Tax=Spiribacter aquaticus TaxID=1935996 RepID=A0A557RGP5_9GAMM|nr:MULTISPECIES: hypothetical protein [Spiribacter]TVO64316.1 hypothetical protein FPL11_06515 [Spiribacter aquaticus]